MKKLKIVTIGGGSSYTPELIEGFIKRYDQMPITELWLVDVKEGEEKLNIIADLARRMVKKANLPIEIHHTLDRRAALKDADFVTTQLRVGQLHARYLDESIPAKYGLLGQETNGAGGFMKAMRTIPVIMDIVKDVKELAPNAWVINFTNPAGIVTEAVLRHANFNKFIGVCNVPIHTQREIEKIMGVKEDELRIDFAGLNHMVFGLNMYKHGVSCKEELLDKMLESQSVSMQNIHNIPWSNEFIRGLDLLPCSYHRYYFQRPEMLEHTLEDHKKGTTRAEVVQGVENELFKKYADVNLDVKPEELSKRGGAHYSDAACDLILGIYADNKTIQVVNTRNNGAISNLADDVVVEVSSIITKEGPRGLTMGEMPYQVSGLIHQMKSFELATVKAALSGKYEDALVALVINPLVASEQLAKKALDEMLVANEKHLPQFKDAIEKIKSGVHN